MQVLIIGATGKVGSDVLRHVAASEHSAYAAVRSPERAAEKFTDIHDLHFRAFDYQDTSTFSLALSGMEAVFFIGPPGSEIAAPMTAFFQAARDAGIQQLVFNSGRTTGDIPGKPLYLIEQMLPDCGINYTILRPGWFMQNFSTWFAEDIRKESKIHIPAGNSKTAFIDTRDIADVVVHLLGKPAHFGKTFDLVSAEAYDHYEVAQLISLSVGRTIEYIDHSPESFTQEMRKKGWSDGRH